MTTEISDAARDLVQRLFDYFIDYRYGSSGTPVLWHVEASEKAAQLALTAARNSALEEMRPFVDLAKSVLDNYYNGDGDEQSVAQEARRLLSIRAMKVRS